MPPTTRRPESNRRRRSRRWTVSRALTLFMGLSLLSLGLSISLLLTLRMDRLLDAQRQLHAGGHAHTVADDLNQRLRTHLQVLRDHADFPLMVQALMQPETHTGIIADFMQGLNFLGEPTREVLLDFRGRVINASRHGQGLDYSTQPWIKALLAGERNEHVGLVRTALGDFWQLALPVLYNGKAEGVLVAELPVARLFRSARLDDQTQGIRIELRQHGRIVHHLGRVADGDVMELPGPVPDTRLRFVIDEHMARQASRRMRIEIAALMGCVVLLTGWLSIRLARRWFADPLRSVQACANALVQNKPCPPPKRDHRLKELNDLSYGIRRMAERIREREHSLNTSHDRLEQALRQLQDSQQRLVQSEKMASLGVLAAGVAHEINTPIGYIQGNLSILRDYQSVLSTLAQDYRDLVHERADTEPELTRRLQQRLGDEDLDFLLEDMRSLMSDSLEGGCRVADIVAGLKSFTHSGAYREVSMDLNQCVRDALQLLEEELDKTLRITLNLGDLPMLRGEPSQITQVVANLLTNAAKATQGAGRIEVTTRIDGNRVRLEVEDDGEGIADEHMDQLFTPFFTTNAVGQGVGLGLSVCHGIIKCHGGEIWAESTPGAGSRFCIDLPPATAGGPTEMEPPA